MTRCPLCKTLYPDEVYVCKIDGTALAGTGTVAPSQVHREKIERPNSKKNSQSFSRQQVSGQELFSQTQDEHTRARMPHALNPSKEVNTEEVESRPLTIASGSRTEAPKDSGQKKWTPFVEQPVAAEPSSASKLPSKLSESNIPTGLENQSSEEWVGQSLGSYKLLSILGKGGMGCVYRAEHTKLGRDVALKVLRTDYSKRKDAVARFFQEARAVNKVRHRNIVDITDLVELDSGIVFIIMEFLEGLALSKLLKNRKDLDDKRLLDILIQICDGLDAAHSVGIVHRDLKPDNIIVIKDDSKKDLVKILDFGVAKLIDKNSDNDGGEEGDVGMLTVAGSVVGTPAFMSPEQAGALQVDGRADIYSLGAIMYEMFAKQQIFRGKSFGEYVHFHLHVKPTPPSETLGGKNIDPRIEAVIMKCLEKSPSARFQSAIEFKEALQKLLCTPKEEDSSANHFSVSSNHRAPTDGQWPLVQDTPRLQSSELYKVQDSNIQSIASDVEPPENMPTHAYRQELSSQAPISPENYANQIAAQHHSSGFLPATNQTKESQKEKRSLMMYAALFVALCCIVAVTVLVTTKKTETNHQDAVDKSALQQDVDGKQTSNAKSASILPPTETPQNTLVRESNLSVQINSKPAAALYEQESNTLLCRTTPCTITIKGTNAQTVQKYVLRTDLYIDKKISIDPKKGKEKIFVKLDKIPTPSIVSLPEPATATATATQLTKNSEKKPKKKKQVIKKKKGKTKSDRKPRNTPKEKCKAGAQDTFNPFGKNKPCR